MSNESVSGKISYPQITLELEAMVEADQDMREKNLQNDEAWDEEVDKRNTEKLKEIVAKIGWPTRSKVGEEGMQNAWLLVQHADRDIDFQIHCLELMKAEGVGEVDKKRVAYLEDRVRVNQGKLQLYGTQFIDHEGTFGPRPIEDEEQVNERRAEMGMESIEEYTQKIHEKYGLSQK
jgi:hypothetical protein